MLWGMIGQGGGRIGSVQEMEGYCLRRRWRIFGKGGGREFLMDKIGVGVGKIGHGGGRRFVVVLTGGCLLWWRLL
jgi:hypothetical protein